MRKKLPVIIAYLVLLALSLVIPLLHHYHVDRFIESLRPYMILEDGSYAPMLMPTHLLFVRWCGQLSWWITFFVLVFFILSFWREKFARFATICTLAICQCAFTTLYLYILYQGFFLVVYSLR